MNALNDQNIIISYKIGPYGQSFKTLYAWKCRLYSL